MELGRGALSSATSSLTELQLEEKKKPDTAATSHTAPCAKEGAKEGPLQGCGTQEVSHSPLLMHFTGEEVMAWLEKETRQPGVADPGLELQAGSDSQVPYSLGLTGSRAPRAPGQEIQQAQGLASWPHGHQPWAQCFS
jgi:hypothetical protein